MRFQHGGQAGDDLRVAGDVGDHRLVGGVVAVELAQRIESAYAQKVSVEMDRMGLKPITTRGFVGSAAVSDEEFAHAMSTCRFAISCAGSTLYTRYS